QSEAQHTHPYGVREGADTRCPPCPLLSARCGEQDRMSGFSLSPLAGRGKGRGHVGLPCPSGEWEETPTRGFDLIGLKSLQREGDDIVASLVVELDVAAGGNDDVLLAVDRIGGRWRVDAGAGVESPQYLAIPGVIGAEAPIAFAREHEAAGRRQNAADHRLRRLYLPANFAGVVIDRRDVAGLLFGWDDLEGAAEPELALRIGRAFHKIVHRLMQVDRIGYAEVRIDRDRRPFDAAVGARQHASALRGRQRPHVLLRHHGFGEADEAAILAIVYVHVTGLAGVDHARNNLAALVLDVDQNRRADRIQVPHVVGDILEVANVLASVEIERDERVSVEVVARALRAVEVGRGIAHHEIDAVGGKVDRRILPHAAAERLVGIAGLGELLLFGGDVAVHVATGGVLLGPHPDGVFRRRIESPQQLAVFGVVGLEEAANAVFAAVGADQHFAFDDGGRHGLAVAELWVRNGRLPHDLASLGI